MGYSRWDRKQLDTTECLILFHTCFSVAKHTFLNYMIANLPWHMVAISLDDILKMD